MADSRFFINKGPFTVKELAEVSESKVVGDSSLVLKDLTTLEAANVGDISFLSNVKYLSDFKNSKASVCITEERFAKDAPQGMTLLINANPYNAQAVIASKFYPSNMHTPHIDEKAVISKSAKIGKNCHIEALAVIEDNAEIGDNTYIAHGVVIARGVRIGSNTQIRANTTITHAFIGNNCIIHPGVRIGQDGFGFATHSKGVTKIEQLGRVVIGNGVEIGANTCIDRGAIGDTHIDDHTKIDNLVQIGHNVRIGKYCFIVSQTGIAGSTQVGDKVMIGGQAGLSGHVKIGAGSMIAARGGIMHDLEPGSVVGGSPAMPIRQWHKVTALLKKMSSNKEKVSHE